LLFSNRKSILITSFVYLFDHQGNSVNSNLSNTDRHHQVAVNSIDVGPKGECVATCSDDGKVSPKLNDG